MGNAREVFYKRAADAAASIILDITDREKLRTNPKAPIDAFIAFNGLGIALERLKKVEQATEGMSEEEQEVFFGNLLQETK